MRADRRATLLARQGTVCECGNEKRPGDEGCDRCMDLDGTSIREAETIWALRAYGPATAELLAERIGVTRTGVFPALRTLRGRGRLTKRTDGTGGYAATIWYGLQYRSGARCGV